MPKKMRTCGDLRDFLLEMMEGVRNGSVDLQRASTVAKLAGQVTASLCAEAQIGIVAQKIGREMGTALLGSSEAEPETSNIIPPPKEVRTGAPVWCPQCEERVHPSKAEECKSPFCKAKALAA